MAAFWTEDNSIGNELGKLSLSLDSSRIEEMKKKRAERQAREAYGQAYADFNETQRPQDLGISLPPEWGGSINLDVPTYQWTNPNDYYERQKVLANAKIGMGAYTTMKNAQDATAAEALNTVQAQGIPKTQEGLTTLQTQLTGQLPATAVTVTDPLKDDAAMRTEMSRLQAKADAGQLLTEQEIRTGQQIAAKQFGTSQVAGTDENGRPVQRTVLHPPTPGYERFAGAIGWPTPGQNAQSPTTGVTGGTVGAPSPTRAPTEALKQQPPLNLMPGPNSQMARELPPQVTAAPGSAAAGPQPAPPPASAAAATAPPPIVPPGGARPAPGVTTQTLGPAPAAPLREKYEAQPEVKAYATTLGALEAGLAARANKDVYSDRVLLQKYQEAILAHAAASGATLNDPKYSGTMGALKGMWDSVMGGAALSDQQRDQIIRAASTQAEVAYRLAKPENERFRVLATNAGIADPNIVAPELPPPPKFEPLKRKRSAQPLSRGPTTGPGPTREDADAIVGG